MIKPPYLNPDMKDAWKLQLKNIYRIDLGTIIKSIDLNIYYKINNLLFSSWYSDSFLRLFGFDQINSSEAPVPDGKFDQRPYFTYLPSTSDIIFPVLQPFGNNCPKQVLDLCYHAIYDSSKSSLTQKDGFVIKGSIVPD
jgi:cell surface protein SprA